MGRGRGWRNKGKFKPALGVEQAVGRDKFKLALELALGSWASLQGLKSLISLFGVLSTLHYHNSGMESPLQMKVGRVASRVIYSTHHSSLHCADK